MKPTRTPTYATIVGTSYGISIVYLYAGAFGAHLATVCGQRPHFLYELLIGAFTGFLLGVCIDVIFRNAEEYGRRRLSDIMAVFFWIWCVFAFVDIFLCSRVKR